MCSIGDRSESHPGECSDNIGCETNKVSNANKNLFRRQIQTCSSVSGRGWFAKEEMNSVSTLKPAAVDVNGEVSLQGFSADPRFTS